MDAHGPVTIVAVVNPTSGGGQGGRIGAQLRQLLQHDNDLASSFRIHDTTHRGDGVHLAEAWCRELWCAHQQRPSAAWASDGPARRVLIVVGGDGTLSEVVNGIMHVVAAAEAANSDGAASEPRGEGATHVVPDWVPDVAYIAAGTGSDFARLGLCYANAEDCVRDLRRSAGGCRRQEVDVGRVVYLPQQVGHTNPDHHTTTAVTVPASPPPAPTSRDALVAANVPSRTERHFINVASVGLGSKVVTRAENYKNSCISCCGGKAVFFAASFVELLSMTRVPLTIRPLAARGGVATSEGARHADAAASPCSVDAADTHRNTITTDATVVGFCNGQYFGGGMNIGPGASPSDGLLSMTVWRESLCGFLCGLPSVYNGKHRDWPSTTCTNAVAFEVSSPTDGVRFEIDGEAGHELPARVELSQWKVVLRAPGGAIGQAV